MTVTHLVQARRAIYCSVSSPICAAILAHYIGLVPWNHLAAYLLAILSGEACVLVNLGYFGNRGERRQQMTTNQEKTLAELEREVSEAGLRMLEAEVEVESAQLILVYAEEDFRQAQLSWKRKRLESSQEGEPKA